MSIINFFGIDTDKLKKANDLCEMVLDKTGASTEKRREIYDDTYKEYYYYAEGSGNNITNNILFSIRSILADYLYYDCGINENIMLDVDEVMLYIGNTRINEYLDS